MTRASFILGLLVPVLASAQQTDPARAGDGWYTVQPGDSCWSIALKLFGEGDEYQIIHSHNDLGPMPHLLQPGQRLRIPGGNRPDASVNWLKRDVKAKAPRAGWRKARAQMELYRLYKVSTGDDSSAGIVFEDQSRLQMKANALLVIYGASASRSRLRKMKNVVTLEQGTLRGGLAKMDAQSAGIEVRTPSGRVSVTGREAQIEVTPEQSAHVSVFDGTAEIVNEQGSVAVQKDFGTVVKPKRKPQKPRPLPPAPTWRARGLASVIVVPNQDNGVFEARWNPVKRADRYRFQLSRDQAFRRTVLDAVMGSGVQRFRATDLEPGVWYARVAAIDSDRLEGHPSAALTLRVVRLQTTRTVQGTAKSGLEVAGFVGMSLPDAVRPLVRAGFGAERFRAARWPVRLYKPGTYTLRFLDLTSEHESRFQLTVLPVAGAIQGAGTAFAGDSITVTLQLRDSKQRPAVLPEIALHAEGVGAVPLVAVGNGDWAARIAIPADFPTGAMGLSAGWPGGELARAELLVTGPFEDRPEPETAVRDTGPLSTEGAQPVPGLPALPARGVTAVGFSTFIAAAADAGDPVTLRAALRGSLRVEDWTLRVDAPFFDARPADPVDANEFGDLRLSAHWLGVDEKALWIAGGLRLTLPTGGFARAAENVVIEPGVILDGDVDPGLRLGTHQAIPLSTDFADSTTFAWTSAYWLSALAADWLELIGEINAMVPIEDGNKPLAFQAGAGARFLIGPVRLGLSGTAALGEASTERFGVFRVGLTVDILPR
ncbi:MAG: hypothetical protein ACI9WU_002032 [Myxococcota bacterium]|jgi:hypothetical protein